MAIGITATVAAIMIRYKGWHTRLALMSICELQIETCVVASRSKWRLPVYTSVADNCAFPDVEVCARTLLAILLEENLPELVTK